MAVQVYSQSGSNDIEKSGHPGELVCVMPFPSMPVALWGDKTGETYRKAYFDKFPGVWHHGDFLAINPATKGVIMLGRRYPSYMTYILNCSDGVLNPAGVRVGYMLMKLIVVWLS
jgi:acetoacetyl-CoA synthetase